MRRGETLLVVSVASGAGAGTVVTGAGAGTVNSSGAGAGIVVTGADSGAVAAVAVAGAGGCDLENSLSVSRARLYNLPPSTSDEAGVGVGAVVTPRGGMLVIAPRLFWRRFAR